MDDVVAFCQAATQAASQWSKKYLPKLVWPQEEVSEEVQDLF